MSRLTEYTVVSGRRTSCRFAEARTSTPSGVNATTEGRSACPSRSGITFGSPVSSSRYATRLLVVPRSMPTIRDMSVLTLSECRVEVVDHRAQVRPGRQRFLEGTDEAPPIGGGRGVPCLAELPGEARLDVPEPGEQVRAGGEPRLLGRATAAGWHRVADRARPRHARPHAGDGRGGR